MVRAFRRREIWRRLILLQTSNFMLDVLLGVVALDIVDVAGGNSAQGVPAAAAFTAVGLVGDILIIPSSARFVRRCLTNRTNILY